MIQISWERVSKGKENPNRKEEVELQAHFNNHFKKENINDIPHARPLVYSIDRPLTCSVTLLFTCSFTRLFTCSFILDIIHFSMLVHPRIARISLDHYLDLRYTCTYCCMFFNFKSRFFRKLGVFKKFKKKSMQCVQAQAV